jgi:exosortase
VIVILALFVHIYGWESFSGVRFPLLFLLLAVPLPGQAMDWLVLALQHRSADAAYQLFRLFRIPVVREGLVFSFSRLQIEVAKECSGIRSTTILLVTALVLAHLILRSLWSRVLVAMSSLFIGVAKNGLRIFILSVLGEYVSTSWLDGPFITKEEASSL